VLLWIVVMELFPAQEVVEELPYIMKQPLLVLPVVMDLIRDSGVLDIVQGSSHHVTVATLAIVLLTVLPLLVYRETLVVVMVSVAAQFLVDLTQIQLIQATKLHMLVCRTAILTTMV
jgi:hypothetical protein